MVVAASLALALASSTVRAACADPMPAPGAPALEPHALRMAVGRVAGGELWALPPSVDIAGDGAAALLARAAVAAAGLDVDAARAALRRYFAEPAGDRTLDATAWSIAAGAAFAVGDYDGAARATVAWEAVLRRDGRAGDADRVARSHALPALLADAPPQSLEHAPRRARLPLRRDEAGLPRVQASINGQRQEMVLDTGANLSVLSASAARRLGVRVAARPASVQSSTRSALGARVGVAERLEIGGSVLRNVAFLVLDDASLRLPVVEGYRIDAVLGFPVFRALGRVRFEPDAFVVAPAPAADACAGAPLRVRASDLFVAARVDGVHVPLHLDTGASATFLTARFGQAHAERLGELALRERPLGGAGGVVRGREAVWPDVTLELGGRSLRFPELAVQTGDDGFGHWGTLGQDALGAFASVTVDLEAMRLRLGAPLPAPDPP